MLLCNPGVNPRGQKPHTMKKQRSGDSCNRFALKGLEKT